MIPCVCGKKMIAPQCFDVISKEHDHILLVDDKKITEAKEKYILCYPLRGWTTAGPLLDKFQTLFIL